MRWLVRLPDRVIIPFRLSEKQERIFFWVCLGGLALFWLSSSVFVLLYGQPNADEGWYLTASRLVYQGMRPYQDFAYTQMPLLAYIYGIPQAILPPSLLVGRLTSFFLALTTFTLSLIIVYRYVGRAGVLWTALLFTAYLPGIYAGVVVKTYILIACLMTVTFFILTTRSRPEVRYPTAVLSAIAAGMARLSGMAFAVPVWIYALIYSKSRRARIWILIVSALSVILFALLLFPKPGAVAWNVFEYHVEATGPVSGIAGYLTRFWKRLPSLLKTYRDLRLLFIPIVLFGVYWLKSIPRMLRTSEAFRVFILVSVSVAAFELSHLISGRYYSEYFIPGIILSLPILVIMTIGSSRAFQYGSIARVLASLALLAVVIIHMNGWADTILTYYRACEGCSPVVDSAQVGKFIRENTAPGDPIFAMEDLFVAIDADRPVLHGLEMAQFSLTELSEDQAQALHVVNKDMLLRFIAGAAAKTLVLSSRDLELIRSDPQSSRALDERYTLALQKEHFGQKADELFVYIRN